jgi:rod shape-determining protein MreC
VLQVLCIVFLTRNSTSHNAIFAGVANEVTGRIDQQYNNVEYYFKLKEANRKLVEENARLHNLLLTNFDTPDSSIKVVVDTNFVDTLGKTRKFLWLPAKVVNNSTNEEANYMTLHRGSKQGVIKDMAVVAPEGIVGRVIFTSENYSRVMSLLNRYSKVSAMLKRSRFAGIVDWDGKLANELVFHNVPKSLEIKRGDSVVTSNLSGNFPEGLMIGTVDRVLKTQSSNFYSLRIKTSVNFFNVQYVYLVQNNLLEEQQKLEAQTPKQQ